MILSVLWLHARCQAASTGASFPTKGSSGLHTLALAKPTRSMPSSFYRSFLPHQGPQRLAHLSASQANAQHAKQLLALPSPPRAPAACTPWRWPSRHAACQAASTGASFPTNGSSGLHTLALAKPTRSMLLQEPPSPKPQRRSIQLSALLSSLFRSAWYCAKDTVSPQHSLSIYHSCTMNK